MANQVLYGFYDLQSIFDQRVSDTTIPQINRAIQITVDEHNRQLASLFGLFIKRTTDFKVRYQSATLARLQPLDQNGRARPIQAAGYYEVAFPLQEGGTAWGANYRARAKMTVEEVNNITATMLMADIRWIRDHILAALFTNTSWTFTDPMKGSLTIQGLANSDTVTYNIMTGADAGATDTHYLAQAAAISDSADPFDAIFTELKEHPENGGEVVALIPTNQKSAVQGLSSYYPANDANLTLGNGVTQLTGRLGVEVPGTVFGYHDAGVWLVEWPNMVSDYIIATTTEGERPIAMREEPEPELQGFKKVGERNDHPFWEAQWLRIAGFGAWNRVGAVVQRIGNGSYAIPTNYSSPMP